MIRRIALFLCFILFACGATAFASGRVIVLDTDIGTDDAYAFMVAAMSENLNIDYFVATSGNGTLDDVCRNALTMRKYWGMDGAVVRGDPCEGVASLAPDARSFHGSDGLGGIRERLAGVLGMTPEDYAETMPYEDFKAALREADAITYIAIGPLTVLSELIDDDAIKSRIDRVLLMGGGINIFNCEHNAEFNFSKDPASAKKIIGSGLDITLFPLDVTHTQKLSEAQIAELESTVNYAAYIALAKYDLNYNIIFNRIDTAILHDTLPIFYLKRPEVFDLADMCISVDEYGATRVSEDGSPIRVALTAPEGLLTDFLKDTFANGCPDGFVPTEE